MKRQYNIALSVRYIDIPFISKNGAKWDSNKWEWYIPANTEFDKEVFNPYLIEDIK